ncbi:IS66 family transposase [Oligella ureolytica]
MTTSPPSLPTDLSTLSAAQLLEIIKEKDAIIAQTQALISQKEAVIAQKEAVVTHKEQTNKRLELKISQLTMELATLRRISFAKRSEQLPDLQARLFEEDALTDIAEVEAKLEGLRQELAHETTEAAKATAKSRVPTGFRLPAALPAVNIRHDLDSTSCSCGCAMRHIGDDISQKLDYTPGTFTVENHIRPKYVCDECKTLNQAPVPPHIIDKGFATTGLLASVLIMKYADHLPSVSSRSDLRTSRLTHCPFHLSGLGRCMWCTA